MKNAKQAIPAEDNQQRAFGMSRETYLFVRAFFRRRIAVVALVVSLIVIFVGVCPSLFSPYDPIKQDVINRLSPPSTEHLFGTDTFGRDVLSRVIHGTTVSLKVGVFGVAIAFSIGLLLGTVSAYYGGILDLLLMRLIDVMLSFPTILLAIAIMAMLGSNLRNVIITIGATYVARFVRIARGAVIAIREEEYVSSARAIGMPNHLILWRYIIPNSLAPSLVMATTLLGTAILLESALSFLGLGVPQPQPTWGNIIADGRNVLEIAPWISIASGVAIMVTVLAFNILGDALRDALDPHKND